jgi:hypothetical protein
VEELLLLDIECNDIELGGFRQTKIQRGESLAPLRLRLLLESLKSVSLQVLIRFQQNCFEQEGK